MKLKEMYDKSFGNWDSAYSGSVADIPPAIVSWAALGTVVTCLAVAGDAKFNDGDIADRLIGTPDPQTREYVPPQADRP